MPVPSKAKTELFVVSALFLFLELAFIRWLPAHVLFLTFFTNTVLLASFLGLSLGCLGARHRRNYLAFTPAIILVTLAAGLTMEWVRLALQNVIDVGGNQLSPNVVYFGTEIRTADVAQFAIPIELVAGVFFVLVALSMAGLGQYLGRCFAAMPNAVEAYMVNIGGSLAGIALFQACSWALPPFWWFAAAAAAMAWLRLREVPRPPTWAIAATLIPPVLLIVPGLLPLGVISEQFPVEKWSPYYRINYSPQSRTIAVNLLGHQNMVSRKDPFPAYAIPYLLNRDSDQPPFRNILIIGAGSGNDLSRALQWAAPDARIDTVEIDPVILSLGKRDHPDRPYQDPRVTAHLGDGRNFLRSTHKKYDLIIFALIDSLVLHSSVSNIRLESYLFTKESIADVQSRLKPNGMFAAYNYFRQGWIVSRLAATMDSVFGRLPLVVTLPNRETVTAEQKAEGFTLLFAGPRAHAIESAFRRKGPYFIQPHVAPTPASPDGFASGAAEGAIRLSPARVEIPADLRLAEDAWPFLYLRRPMIPQLSWRGIAVMGCVSLVMLLLFGWRPRDAQPVSQQMAMLLLGAGFMLLETKAVVHMALIFGSTWIVNLVVFSAVLLMILAANLWVLRRAPSRLAPYFIGLLATLALNMSIPLDLFLGLPQALQGIAAGALVLSPVFCAGVIFATLFRQAAQPEQALAYNTAGAMIGGFAETASLLIGFRYLLALAALVYILCWTLTGRERQTHQMLN